MIPGITGIGGFLVAGAAPAVTGALVYASTGLAGTGDIFEFDSEDYDDGSFHSTGTNPGRLTISAAGNYRFSAGIHLDTTAGAPNEFVIRKGTGGGTPTSSYAYAAYGTASTAGNDSATATSPIHVLSGGEEFDVEGTAGHNAFDLANSWFSVEKVDTALRGALVSRSTGLALSAGVTTDMTWDTTGRDDGNWHDAAGASASMVVISGVTLIRLTACGFLPIIGAANSGEQFVLSMQKNGGSVPGLPRADQFKQSIHTAFGLVSAILVVTAGDAFKLRAFSSLAGTLGGSSGAAQQGTWFQIEEIDPATRYCLVKKAATQVISATTFTAVTFGASSEVADAENTHSTASNTSRIVSPATATQWRASFNITGASATGQLIGGVRVNGTDQLPGMPKSECETAGADSVNGMGAWTDIATPGTDYCELFVWSDPGQTLPISDETWLQVEFR